MRDWKKAEILWPAVVADSARGGIAAILQERQGSYGPLKKVGTFQGRYVQFPDTDLTGQLKKRKKEGAMRVN